ncbi:enoyl-CoA hydratase [Mycobacterium sp. MS1601]|uniref:enoyl-CoA hydratase n=1 Tax=Mycobacterium sp. MS1601 TaxID=1936029 RepID=UPI00097927DA|nr:enoyl-CoA hydratase [Mycobacterium sp. MS1601]AQA06499.1 enoyl-CoA hydratase [Mycobacterium sp. MS1601]
MTTTSAVDGLLVDLTDGVLSVTINRPDSLNSLNAAVLAGIADTFEAAADDPGVKVARLGGAGRGFSSGAGIGADDAGSIESGGDPVDVLYLANRAIRSIVNLPRPVVSVVQGPAAGVGVSLALAGDLVLASDKAFFMLAFTKIGLMPDGGASALVAASVGRARAMRMALLAERISAADALAWGLVSNVYPADQFDAEVAAVIAQLGVGPVVSQALTKRAVNAATLTELEPALGLETEGQIALLHASDFREGVKAFQERRTPTFTDT